jgi:DNA-binding ferritin-like protein
MYIFLYMADYISSRKSILTSVISKGGDFKLEDFVNEVQAFSLGLRLTHWGTTSYELHKAVEMTQDSMDDLLDKFVEAAVGFNGGTRPVFTKDVVADDDENKMISCLKGLATKDTSLLNIRDEMLQACYKFKYLKTLK